MNDLADFTVWLIGGGLIGATLIAAWPILLAAACIVLLYWWLSMIVAAWRRDNARKEARIAALINRADAQHAALIRGDEDTGLYGAYQPHRWD